MKNLLIVGNDKIGRKLLSNIEQDDELLTFLDSSNSVKRVIKLVSRGSLKLSLVIKMFWANLFRKNYSVKNYPQIFGNSDLRKLLKSEKDLNRIYLFRAGLIINRKTLDSFPNIFNVHCGRLPDYGGLGIIQRALENGDLNQCATLYQITETIDDGEIEDTQPFVLDKSRSYKNNEDIAYDAGISLMIRTLRKGKGEANYK